MAYAGGTSDFFIAKYNAAGNYQWGTYKGTVHYDYMPSCAVDQKGFIYIMGEWEDPTIPYLPASSCGFQQNFGGQEDQYITKYDPAGKIICATYLGGTAEDDMDVV